jgi:cell division protein FtsQ
VKYNWKKILILTAWLLAGAGTIVLFGAAMLTKNQKKCADIRIEITGAEKHMFIDEKDVTEMLNARGKISGTAASALNLRSMEALVEKNPWVRNAEMFLDNQQVLQVVIEERQPVARVFTVTGQSFYLDSAALRLPLSDKISARVPMFTGFPSDKPVLSKPDSALLHDVVKLGQYVLADSFWMAQTAQLAITPQARFEMVPVLGDHLVILGDATELDAKFKRLYTFYKKAWLQNGINTYEKLDVQYNNQVLAVRKGTARALADSARAREIMNGMAAAQVAIADSAGIERPQPAAAKPKPDTGQVRQKNAIAPVKSTQPAVNKQTTPVKNNKADIKTLSNGNKAKQIRAVAKPTPKAVMKKT